MKSHMHPDRSGSKRLLQQIARQPIASALAVGALWSIVSPVSAVDRTGVLESTKAPMIQLDASINVGNTGGPLFDLEGELIGIVAARSRQAEGIAFAVPIDHVAAFLRAVDTRRSGVVGVVLDLQGDTAPALALGYEAGLAVEDVVEPAVAAGLREISGPQ